MKPIIYVAAGLALLIVLLIGGGVAWLSNKVNQVATTKVDVSNQDTVDTFKTKFVADCTSFAAKTMNNPDYQRVALVKQVCTCDANALIAYMKRKKDMTVLKLASEVLVRSPEVRREFDNCAQAYGISFRPN
jgi:hypothetical protein